jgi:hypothetical protein
VRLTEHEQMVIVHWLEAHGTDDPRLRHHYCSHLAHAKVDPFAVMKLMGHSSLNIVLTYYPTTELQLSAAVRPASFAGLMAATTGGGPVITGGTPPKENNA